VNIYLAALRKCDPRVQWRNPILMLVEVGAAISTVYALWETIAGDAPTSGGGALPIDFNWTLTASMWLTLYVANIAEAAAEGRGHAHTAGLRSATAVTAHRIHRYNRRSDAAGRQSRIDDVSSTDLQPGDFVVAEAGDAVPADGEVVWGIASIDESAITGESAPVIRESGGDRSAVTGGTQVLSDRIVMRVTSPIGDTRVDRMISLAVGAHRVKAPNEIALSALLASFSISFILIALTLNAVASPVAAPVSVPILAAVVAILIEVVWFLFLRVLPLFEVD
jgi:K+-transporting ATPase ATPase B chain